MWINLYQAIINRDHHQIQEIQKELHPQVFENLLRSTCLVAYLNGMQLDEITRIIRDYLGEQKRFHEGNLL